MRTKRDNSRMEGRRNTFRQLFELETDKLKPTVKSSPTASLGMHVSERLSNIEGLSSYIPSCSQVFGNVLERQVPILAKKQEDRYRLVKPYYI